MYFLNQIYMDIKANDEELLFESKNERANIIGGAESLNETDNIPFPDYEKLFSLDKMSLDSIDILKQFYVSVKNHNDDLGEIAPAVYFILDMINLGSEDPIRPEVYTMAYGVIRDFLKYKVIDPFIIINYEGFLEYLVEKLDISQLAPISLELLYYMTSSKDAAQHILMNVGIEFIVPSLRFKTFSVHHYLALYTINMICCKKTIEPELFSALTTIVLELLSKCEDLKNAMWAANALMKRRFIFKRVLDSSFKEKVSMLSDEKVSLFIQFANNAISNPEGESNLKTAAICVLSDLIPERHNEEIFLGEIVKIISEPVMDEPRAQLVYMAMRFFSRFFSAVEEGSVNNELAMRVINETPIVSLALDIMKGGKFKLISLSIHILWTLIRNRVIVDFTEFVNPEDEVVSTLAMLASSQDMNVQVWVLDILLEIFGSAVNSGTIQEFMEIVDVNEVKNLIADIYDATSNYDVEFRSQRLIDLLEDNFFNS